MSKTSAEDRKFIMSCLKRLSDKLELKGSIKTDNYADLHKILELGEDWSVTRLRNVMGSLHHNGRYVKIIRTGEPMRGDFNPQGYVFLMTKSFDA